MPRVSEFYGIVITMYWNEHGPPHFHARYSEFQAAIGIEDAVLLVGHLPPTASKMVMMWASDHRDELSDNWWRLSKHLPPKAIEPLP